MHDHDRHQLIHLDALGDLVNPKKVKFIDVILWGVFIAAMSLAAYTLLFR